MQKLPVDLKGSGYLIFLSMLLASNQIAIKVGNQGFDPVFMAAARSLIGLLALFSLDVFSESACISIED